jgi:hypothetical protein
LISQEDDSMKNLGRILTVAMGSLALAGSAFAANSLAVVNGGLNGTGKALAVTVDGSLNNVYVEDQSPNNESHYKFDFFLCPNNLNLQANKSVRIAAVNGNLGQHIVVFLRRDVPGGGVDQWLLNTWVSQSDSNPGTYEFATSTFLALNGAGAESCATGSAAHRRIEIEFTAGTGANGSLVVRRLSNAGAVQVTKQVTNRNSDGFDVDDIRIGALAGSGDFALASTNYRFDEFSSYR